jgi:hypothetical protein
LLILERTWFAFGLSSRTGCDIHLPLELVRLPPACAHSRRSPRCCPLYARYVVVLCLLGALARSSELSCAVVASPSRAPCGISLPSLVAPCAELSRARFCMLHADCLARVNNSLHLESLMVLSTYLSDVRSKCGKIVEPSGKIICVYNNYLIDRIISIQMFLN